ncbi:hypothetical protein ATANTOWER_027695 [Ataeniobius toweri]|uniref:Uncharacterized protein n=1 Tax=Ataeniobius toweri TaxID=208326 RepID=A0ABU7BDJ0_9TELE|nr:hypothetical protein [Ataeniobius toweri]
MEHGHSNRQNNVEETGLVRIKWRPMEPESLYTERGGKNDMDTGVSIRGYVEKLRQKHDESCPISKAEKRPRNAVSSRASKDLVLRHSP